MVKQIFILSIFISSLSNVFAQKKTNKYKIGLGAALFDINESFNDFFIFNNSRPIYLSLTIHEKFRIESITNLSVTDYQDGEDIHFAKGSFSLAFQYIKPTAKKFDLYFGSKVGLNSNKTKLVNLHIGGELYLHKRWSITNEIGANYLIEYDKYFQTTSSVILRFYF